MTYTLYGKVLQTLISPQGGSIRSAPQPQVRVVFEGFEGDRHSGLTMRSGGRTPHYPRGTEIRNSRQVSIVSEEDLAETAAAMDLPAISAEALGANLLLGGIPSLTLLPPSTRLYFDQAAVLVVEGENLPCTIAGAEIQADYPDKPGLTSQFPRAGLHRRGIVAWVERPGVIAPGDQVRVEVPALMLYPPES